MCSRYFLDADGNVIAYTFSVPVHDRIRKRFNIAPTQEAPVVRVNAEGTREVAMLRWGLVPFWSKDLSVGNRMINARAETVADKPAFREALLARRCLVPADGFFEWKRVGTEKSKQPYWFQLADREPFAFAGLWERWYDPAGVRVESFAILTTRPNSLVASFHDRMPVILGTEAYAMWLDPAVPPPLLEPLYEPIPAERMIVRAVSMRVNNARNDDPGCVEEVTEAPPPKQGSLF